MMNAPAKIVDVTMEEKGYRRKGTAAMVTFRGQIEGRVILDMEPRAAAQVASCLTGDETGAESIVPETVCELANMVIGNAVTQLNDCGFQFKVFPPEMLTQEECAKTGQNAEATILCFETPSGSVYLNIVMQYMKRRARERGTIRVN
jgi:chemotaxis protein CheX